MTDATPTSNEHMQALRVAHSAIIKIAAELARGEGVADWSAHKFYRTTPMGERRDIMNALRNADEALRVYAVRLRSVADVLSAEIRSGACDHETTPQPTECLVRLPLCAKYPDCPCGGPQQEPPEHDPKSCPQCSIDARNAQKASVQGPYCPDTNQACERMCQSICNRRASEWQPIETAPKGVLVEGLNADGDIDRVEWRETRQCMLSTVAHGAGEVGAGWVSKDAGNLPIDPPTAWRPIRSGQNGKSPQP